MCLNITNNFSQAVPNLYSLVMYSTYLSKYNKKTYFNLKIANLNLKPDSICMSLNITKSLFQTVPTVTKPKLISKFSLHVSQHLLLNDVQIKNAKLKTYHQTLATCTYKH